MEKELYGKILKELVDMCDGITENKWNDIIDRYDMGIHKDSLRKAFGTTEFSGYNVYKYLIENNVSDNEKVDELREKIRELEIKKVQYKDERRINSKYMRPLARHERMLDVIKDEICNLEPLVYDKAYIGNAHNTATLLCSDLHYGIVCDNYWNKYNMDIAQDRMFKVVSDTIEYCKKFNINTLHFALLGDLISGVIHKTLELENEVDVVQQTLKCAELLSTCLNELANEIPNIKVHMTVGNHSRVTPNKKESVDTENFEYFVWEFMKLRCVRDDVEFVDNDIDETFIHYEVNGEHIIGVHGHLDRVSKVVSDFATMFSGMKIKAVYCGHLHHEYTNEINGIKLVMNSTLSGTDTHSKNMRYVGKPSQTLIIYDGDNTINFNLKLS